MGPASAHGNENNPGSLMPLAMLGVVGAARAGIVWDRAFRGLNFAYLLATV